MPRTFVTADRTLLAGNYNVSTRFEVKDSDGTWRDLTAYTGGRNFFVSAKWTRGLDQPVMAGTVTLLRSVLGASLAPTIVGSIMNTNAASAYVPLLAGGRPVRLSTAATRVGLLPGFNSALQSRTLGVPPWGGTTTAAQDSVGLDGLSNTATTLTDSSAAVFQWNAQNVAIPNDSASHTVRFWVKKDAITTRAPQLRLTLTGGTTQVSRSASVNTSTGQFVSANTTGTGTQIVEDGALYGDPLWWVVTVSCQNNSTGNTTLAITIYPAARATYNGVDDATVTGSIVMGGVVLQLNSTTAGQFIETTTVGVSDFREVFLGRIDDPDWGGDDATITVTISDIGAWLLGKNIDTERVYSNATGVALETVIQSILTDNVSGPLGAVTLYTPVSPGWNVRTFTQQKVNVLTAIRALAQQIGWDVRYVYDASNAYRLTLLQPQRTKTVADYTIATAEYYAVPQLTQNLGDVRTRIGGSYVDASTGVRLWRYVQSDAAHTNQYDVVYMEITEDASSNIDSATEMDKMLNAALSDLQDPAATQRVESSYFWIAELGDLVGWPANAVHYDTTQKLAVVLIEHTLEAAGETTSLTCRGNVAGNLKEWLAIQGNADAPSATGPSLDVIATGGATTYSIAYTGVGVQLSINGGAYGAAPASPITATRPAAGASPVEYTFRAVLNGQTVVDSVTVQPLDKDTVSPDLSVVLTNQLFDRVLYVVSATNPDGAAAAISITVSPVGCTASWGPTTGLENTIADGATGTLSASSGLYVYLFRPAFGTTAQASATFKASRSGSGVEVIQRSVLNQVKTTFGPSLDVTPTPGTLSYTIAYTASVTPVMRINGTVTALPGTNPFTVTRPAAGGTPLEYSFTVVADGQTVVDSVTVQPIDKDTVTPDLLVTPSFFDPAYIDFIPTASNPSGGAAPNITVLFNATTGLNVTTGVAYSANILYAVVAGDTVRAYRQPFGTTTQAAVTFAATLAGAGSERIMRTVQNVVKTVFGPSLDVVATPGALSYTIGYTASPTPTLRINGSSAALPGTNPFTVSRPAAGGTPLSYEFTGVVDGQTVVDSVTVQPLDKDTVSPDLSVVLTNQLFDRVLYVVSATNPDGAAAAISITVSPKGCTASWGATTGLENSVADGATATLSASSGLYVYLYRPGFGTTAQANASFKASRSGSGVEVIQRSVANQVKTSFGPTITLSSVPSATAVVVTYTYTGTLGVTLNGSTVSASASPWSLPRPAYGSPPDVYEFTSVLDGQTFTLPVSVPAQELVVGSWTITGFYANNAGVTGPPYNRLDLTWSVPTGLPGSGITYDVSYDNGVADGQDSDTTGLTSAAKNFTGVVFSGTAGNPLPGRGMVKVVIKHNGKTVATKEQRKTYTI